MQDIRLIIFDVDGTLVDSQVDILAAMGMAFRSSDMVTPSKTEILSIVGLSLETAFAKLVPSLSHGQILKLTDDYKDAYVALRGKVGAAQSSPMFPHARQILDQLNAIDENLLAVATGKSRRGLDKLLDAHELRGVFVSEQVADHHPSKPDPSMVLACLKETGVEPRNAVMIGDTSFDMDMGNAAGVRTIGVDWGYHPVDRLSGADEIISSFLDLPDAIERVLQ